MKIVRAALSGIIVWILIFASFIAMSFIPVIKDSELQQFIVLYVLLIPIGIAGLKFYYRKAYRTSGLLVGVIMAVTALAIDATITLPFVVIPEGGSYAEFFGNSLLWILVGELIGLSYLYGKNMNE
jgi:RsiW-degrading membrane proteinase PrsW (M82 family)